MSPTFDPNAYGPAVAELLAHEPLCELGPGKPREEFRPQLQKLDYDVVFPGRDVVDHSMADCCISALWLLFDFLDTSHSISQEINTPSGSYWHGIMHRREPDYSNAKYWFRRVGQHPVYKPLAEAAAPLAAESGLAEASSLAQGDDWDAFHFVDRCQQAARGGGELELLCRRIAQAEWRLLFADGYHRAIT
ncbi:MAG: hypothetical protein RIC55_06360 [Pirellulaceae bacterium]